MKRGIFLLILLLVIIASGCTNKQEVNELSDLPPMIMVGNHLYLDTGKEVPIDLNDVKNRGKVHSSTLQHEKPTEDGQTNFGSIGSTYVEEGENIAVLLNGKWILFERAE